VVNPLMTGGDLPSWNTYVKPHQKVKRVKKVTRARQVVGGQSKDMKLAKVGDRAGRRPARH